MVTACIRYQEARNLSCVGSLIRNTIHVATCMRSKSTCSPIGLSLSADVTTYELYLRSGGVEITPQYVCSKILVDARARDRNSDQIHQYFSNSQQ